MRILLHVGTHKTRTSSLQTYLKLNASALQERGILYAAPEGHRNANFLFNDLSGAEGRQANAFLRGFVTKARRTGADVILLSAEAFYAMTTFRQLIDGTVVDDYRAAEARAIGRLRAAIPQAAITTVCCYFRRQDHFLESLYNQIVKVDAYAGSVLDFHCLTKPALDYAGHLDLWRAAFPRAKIIARNHEGLTNGIVEDFLHSVLGLEDRSGLTPQELHINKRLGRDVLEYKRILNRIPCSKAQRHMNAEVVAEISQAIGDGRSYQQYLDSAARARVLAGARIGNEALVQTYDMQPFSEPDCDPELPVYPGLSTERAIEILARHRKIKNSFSYRRRWLGVAVAENLRRRGGVAAQLLKVLRRASVHNLFK